MKTKKRIIFLAICAFILSFLVIPAVAAPADDPQRVFDDSGLFSEDERNELEQKISILREVMQMDIVVLTSSDVGQDATDTYADEFYHNGEFGTGEKYSGIILIMDTGNWVMSSIRYGEMDNLISEADAEQMLDEIYPYTEQDDYGGAVNQFLESVGAVYSVTASDNQGEGIIEDQRLFDQAGLISEEQKLILEQKIIVLQNMMQMDVVVLTASDVSQNGTEAYAKDFYVNGGFGIGADQSGIIFILDTNNGKMFANGYGNMKAVMAHPNIEMLDNIRSFTEQEDYGGGIDQFLSNLKAMYVSSISDIQEEPEKRSKVEAEKPQEILDQKKGLTLSKILGLLIAAAIIPGIVCGFIVYGYKMKAPPKAIFRDRGYQKNTDFMYTVRDQQLIDQQVTHKVIAKNPPQQRTQKRPPASDKKKNNRRSYYSDDDYDRISANSSASSRSMGGGRSGGSSKTNSSRSTNSSSSSRSMGGRGAKR